MKRLMPAALLLSAIFATTASGQNISELIRNQVASSITAAEVMYRDLHQKPELSLMESKTAATMAGALGKNHSRLPDNCKP